jgi:hypothetical protein
MESQLRQQWQRPLAWDGDPLVNNPTSNIHRYREDYYARQKYPKLMTPPEVTVENAEEERRQLAAWRMQSADPVESGKWPQWRFHAGDKPPVMVDNEDQSSALGAGWFPTIEAAFEAVRSTKDRSLAPITEAADEHAERLNLFTEAELNGVKVDRRWSTERLRKAVKGSQGQAAA